MSQELFGREAFRRNVDILLQIRRAWGDKPTVDALHERMDALWEALSEEEEVQVRGVASDLNGVRRGPAPRGPKVEDVRQDDLVRFKMLAQSGELGVEELRLMRRCYPRMPPESVAYRRGRIWAAQGFHALAYVFYEKASSLAPGEPAYSFLALQSLAEVDKEAAYQRALAAVRSPRDTALGEVVEGLLLLFASDEDPLADITLLDALIAASEEAISRVLGLDSPHMASMLATTCLVGGLCRQRRGESQEARGMFELGLRLGAGRNHQLLLDAVGLWNRPSGAEHEFLGIVKGHLDTSLAA